MRWLGLILAALLAGSLLWVTPAGAQHASENPENELVRFYCGTPTGVATFVQDLLADGVVDHTDYGCDFLSFDGYGKYQHTMDIDNTDHSVYLVSFDNGTYVYTFR